MLKLKVFANFGKPAGAIGKLILKGMNISHSAASRWGLSHLILNSSDKVLDIGCGGGANIARLLRLCPKGYVAGIDHSEESVALSSKRNKTALSTRCDIVCADVSDIPFDDNTFDAVTAFETIYFWKDLNKCFWEVNRVLKKDGVFMIEYAAEDMSSAWSNIIDNMTIYTNQELEKYLEQTGFSEIKIHKKGVCVCITAKK